MRPESELRERSVEAVLHAPPRAAREFAATPIGGGRQLSFLALFEFVPIEAAAFQVRAAPLAIE
jgi:hypothetical protein